MSLYSEGLLPRLIMVVIGFVMIVVDVLWLNIGWIKLAGGFFCLYAFAPMKINPLLEIIENILKKGKKAPKREDLGA